MGLTGDRFNSEIHMPSPLDPEILAYTVAETQRVAGIGKTQIYDLINKGHLEARKLGRRTLISGASLREFLDSLPPIRSDPASSPVASMSTCSGTGTRSVERKNLVTSRVKSRGC